MMSKASTTIFIIDDELPNIPEFRKKGIYNSAISMENLYHLAVNSEWNYHLEYLQQLIKDIYTCNARIEGRINIVGFTTPTQAINELKNGILSPDVIIYDWEYLNAPAYSENALIWLVEILKGSNAFIFVYSNLVNNKGSIIPKSLNGLDFNIYAQRFQLFLKGGRIESSFTAEEYIFQHIICHATDRGDIKVNGINVEFTKNNYLKKASDILFLQRVLGSEFILKEFGRINFRLDEFTTKEILDGEGNFLYINRQKNILINPNKNLPNDKIVHLEKITFSEVVKNYSLQILEDTIDRGSLVL